MTTAIPAVDKLEARRFIKSIADGVPHERLTTWLTVGQRLILNAFNADLPLVQDGEFKLRFLLGNPGTGKSHLLVALQTDSLTRNFVTCYCTQNVQEKIAFNRPDQIYGRILESLTVPALDHSIDPIEYILNRWTDQALLVLPSRRSMQVPYKLSESGLLPKDAKAIHPRTRVALVGYIMASELQDTAAKQVFLNTLKGLPLDSTTVVSELLRLGLPRAYIGWTPSRYDTAYYFGQFAVILHIIKSVGYAGTLVLIDEAAAIADLPAHSRRKAYKVIDKIVEDVFKFPALYMIIAYLPALFIQLIADSKQYGLDYVNRWQPVLGESILEVETLTMADKYELFSRLARLHSIAYEWDAVSKTKSVAVRIVETSERKRWSTRDFVRSAIDALDEHEHLG